jgi:hypothetical protein
MAQVSVYDLMGPVAQLVPRCPRTVLVRAYVDAVRQLCLQSRWYKVTVTGSTAALTPIYSLGSDVYNEILGVKAVAVFDGTQDVPLTERFSGLWDLTIANAMPELYQYVPHAQIAVHPTPDAVYDLTVTAVVQPKGGSNSIDDSLVVKWDQAFRSGALAYLLKLPKMQWTDKQEADRQMLFFRDWISKARSDENRAYNAGAQTTDRLGPQNAQLRSKILPI